MLPLVARVIALCYKWDVCMLRGVYFFDKWFRCNIFDLGSIWLNFLGIGSFTLWIYCEFICLLHLYRGLYYNCLVWFEIVFRGYIENKTIY